MYSRLQLGKRQAARSELTKDAGAEGAETPAFGDGRFDGNTGGLIDVSEGAVTRVLGPLGACKAGGVSGKGEGEAEKVRTYWRMRF